MTMLKLIGTVLALSLSSAAFAAGASCCAEMACCKGGKDCCADMKKGGDHAGHNLQGTPKT